MKFNTKGPSIVTSFAISHLFLGNSFLFFIQIHNMTSKQETV